MKARLLRKLLNNTGYIVHNQSECVCIGSPMCSDLITVDKQSLKMKYALNTFNEDVRDLFKDKKNTELLFIWDKLRSLINNGEMKDIIAGDDIIENPIPVYFIHKGKLVESQTDAFGWPNTTKEGYLMYENTNFSDKQQALEFGINDCKYMLDYLQGQLKEQLLKIEGTRKNIEFHRNSFDELSEQLKQIKG